jgi:hypothetical protein
MVEEHLTCVHCSKPIFVGGDFKVVMGEKMHPKCASEFEAEYNETLNGEKEKVRKAS